MCLHSSYHSEGLTTGKEVIWYCIVFIVTLKPPTTAML